MHSVIKILTLSNDNNVIPRKTAQQTARIEIQTRSQTRSKQKADLDNSRVCYT